MDRPPADVGVLFVHGIGEQKRADTLVQFGEGFKDWLERWLSVNGAAAGVTVRVIRADLTQTASESIPAHAELRVSSGNVDQRWMLAESWWASSFQAPRYSDLWRWSLEIVPVAVADHFLRRYRLAQGRYSRLLELLLAGAAIALLPLVTLVMLASLVVGLLPMPQLRTAILRMQKALLGTVGDSYTLLESSIRGAAMSTRVQHDLRWLQSVAGKTVVVAHSQGAAVAHAALQADDAPTPDLLFTFGSGLRKLLVLDIIRGGNRFKLWLLSAGLLLISVGAWQIYRLIVDPTARINWFELQGVDPTNVRGWDLTNLFGIDLTDWRVLAMLSTAVGLITGLVVARGPWQRRLRTTAAVTLVWTVGGLLVAPAVASGPLALVAFTLGSVGLLMFGVGLATLESRAIDTAIDRRLRRDTRVPWIDRYATADPVSNGPPVSSGDALIDSRAVSNLGSPLRDHSTYWSNRDQFVPAVVRAIGHVAGLEFAAVTNWDPERLQWADDRRRWRVRWLVVSRLLAAVTALAMVVRFRGDLWRSAADLPAPGTLLLTEFLDILKSLPFLRLLTGEAGVAVMVQGLWFGSIGLAMWLVYRLFETAWAWWDRHETDRLFRRNDYEPFPWPFIALLALLAGASLCSLLWVASLDRDLLRVLAEDPLVRDVSKRGWHGVYGAYQTPAGFVMVALYVLGASGIAGFIAVHLKDWWMWGQAEDAGARRVMGMTILALPLPIAVASPAVQMLAAQPQPVPQWEWGFFLIAMVVVGMVSIALGTPIVTNRRARALARWMADYSASGPFGRRMAGAYRTDPTTRQRLFAYASELKVSWNGVPAEARTLERSQTFNANAVPVAEALAEAHAFGGLAALSDMAPSFPYAALAGATALAASLPDSALTLIVPHQQHRARGVRRQMAALAARLEPGAAST